MPIEPKGEYSDWKPTNPPTFKCRECTSNVIEYRVWESSDGAHEDYQYHCKSCGRKWWVEGSDA